MNLMDVYLNDRVVFFVPKLPDTILSSDMAVITDSMKDIQTAWLEFKRDENFLRLFIVDPGASGLFFQPQSIHTVEVLSSHSNQFKSFISLFKYIPAAGGLVKNEKGELLFIHRFGLWDLPKGKISKKDFIRGDFAKAAERAAIREVQEETGLNQLEIIRQLPCTWHIYSVNERQMIKQTYWYEMMASSGQLLKPQTEEGITLVQWTSPTQLPRIVANTYRSIKDLLVP